MALLCLAAMLWAADFWRSRRLAGKAQRVTLGMSQSAVLKAMGEPLAVWPKGKMPLKNNSNPETWVYGRKYDLHDSISKEPPFFCPFRFRIWPHHDDVVVEFDESNRVCRIVNSTFQRAP